MLGLSLLFFLLFYGLFWSTDFITGMHTYRINGAFNFERNVPFIPSFSLVYFSGSLALFLSPFMLHKDRQFIPFFKLMILELVVAAILFIIFPFVSPEQQIVSPNNLINWVFIFNDKANLDYNLFPSLHVAFTYTLAFFVSEKKNTWIKIGCFSWATAVGLSTLFTKQHYIIDVAGGLTLAALTYKLKRM